MNCWMAALCLLSGTVLAGCSSSPPPLVNVVEPGDTTLTCPQLGKEINSVSAALGVAHDNVHSQTLSVTTTQAINSFMLAPTDFKSATNGMAVTQLDEKRDHKSRLEQRRANLVGVYNSRCSGQISQAAPEAGVLAR